jgi:transaldolase
VRLFIDSAEIAAIRQALATGFVAGVRATKVETLARQALDAGARELHLQVYASDTAGMLTDARRLVAIDTERVVVKIPATPEGYRATALLALDGIRVTLTAVYTLRQTLLAQSVGAHYIAVYLGRMRDTGLDALALVGQMQALLRAQRAAVTILAASIRDLEEVVTLGVAGIGAATLPAAILGQLLESDATARAAAVFGDDAHAIFEE